MSLFIKKSLTSYKILNWKFVHKKIFKLQNRMVQQLKKKNFRKARHLQRLLLKSLISHLLVSQKFIEIKNSKYFEAYKAGRNDLFLGLLNLNNFIQFENYFFFQQSDIVHHNFLLYFHFLSLLWVLALIPVNETLSDSFFYNYRLYRDQTDILNELCCVYNFTNYKWLLILRPMGFLKDQNQKWLIENILMEKKFLLSILKNRKFVKCNRKISKPKELIEIKKISLIKLIKSSCFYNFPELKENSEKSLNISTICYNNLILVPSANKNHLKIIYRIIFKFLQVRGLSINKNRIWIVNIFDGFNFLGWFLKKEKNRIIFKISYENIKSHQLEIKKFLKSSKFLPIDKAIINLNKKIINWQSYYAYGSGLSQIWSDMNYYIFSRIWRWCKKKHKNKGSKWLYSRYWAQSGSKRWIFHYNKQYLKAYDLKKQKIIPLLASINACDLKNQKKVQKIVSKKLENR